MIFFGCPFWFAHHSSWERLLPWRCCSDSCPNPKMEGYRIGLRQGPTRLGFGITPLALSGPLKDNGIALSGRVISET